MDVPWQVFTSPVEKWAVQPSFVVGEYLFVACALIALVHACKQRDQRGRHLLVWVAAILAGTANDLIFMALPLVDNFWQAQGQLMITVRLPLYIPCVYVCFMYFPTVATWRLNLPPLSRAALSGLAAISFYAPYDIVGAKFLWWTWHDTDQPIANRLLGVPIGSTMWVIIFVATFAWLIGRRIDRDPGMAWRSFGKGVALVVSSCTALMMVQMIPPQLLDDGIPGVRGLAVVVIVYGLVAWWGWRRSIRSAPRPFDRTLTAAVVLYFVVLVLVMAVFDPATHRSTSVHQTYGRCDVEATDIAGKVRRKFICAEEYDEDFSFACLPRLPVDGARWYTVCGRPHADFTRWMFALVVLGVVGSALYSFMLGAWRRSDAARNAQSS